jgi:predicted NBD/HSP70 family sugar kinase
MDVIRRRGPLPRIELSDLTGISRATVTSLTAELIERGLIEEIARPAGSAEGRRGRPRIDLRIRGAAHLVAGVKIAHQTLSLVLMDFNFTRLAEHNAQLANDCLSPGAMIAAIDVAIDDLLGKAGRTRDDLSGVGVGIAGVVQAAEGLVLWSPSLNQRNIGFATQASKELDLPVFVDNDANLVTMAELGFGLGRTHSDFLVITVESGVGMGIVVDGQVYRGAGGCGAEFGHIKMHPDGIACRCGQRGCLEAYVADYALLREAANLPDFDTTLPPDEQLRAVTNRASHDHQARAILERAGDIFALGLANVVNIFDPRLIILAGNQMNTNHLLGEKVVARMKQSIVQVDRPDPEVAVHHWGDLMWALGAAAYALDCVLDRALNEITDHAD